MQVCNVVDVIIVLVDPKIMRFNVREMSMYQELYENHKVKPRAGTVQD